MAKEIHACAVQRFAEVTAPYAAVTEIDPRRIPTVDEAETWDGAAFAAALRHDAANPRYNRHFRQLIHVSFKVAAEMGSRYTDALKAHEAVISRNVTANLFERHILPIFG